MPTVTVIVNGASRNIDAWDPDMPLLYALRNDLGLHAAKFGCGLGQCGACPVLLDGGPVRSCTVRVGDVAGRRVVTAEGLGTFDKPHPVQAAFKEHQDAGPGGASARRRLRGREQPGQTEAERGERADAQQLAARAGRRRQAVVRGDRALQIDIAGGLLDERVHEVDLAARLGHEDERACPQRVPRRDLGRRELALLARLLGSVR